jgi:hypothetical protein
MIFKRLGSVCFAIAFLLAIVVFTSYGAKMIPREIAKIGMIIFGGIALLMNLISFRFDKSSENNPVYWIGSVGIFVGLILKMNHLIYNEFVLIAGIFIVGLSFFYNPFAKNNSTQKDDELLDQ